MTAYVRGRGHFGRTFSAMPNGLEMSRPASQG